MGIADASPSGLLVVEAILQYLEREGSTMVAA